MIMTDLTEKICILGGGFGGLYTALRLSQLPWTMGKQPQIVLIDQSDRFIFTPLLYEIVTGEMETWEIAPPFSELLQDTSIQFYQDQITEIDLDHQQVKLSQNAPVDYTKLVIALGGIKTDYEIEGVKEYALSFRNLADGERLKNQLRLLEKNNPEKIRIAIIGGGYTGVELGCKLADQLGEKGRIRIIERGDILLKNADNYNRKIAESALKERGIWLDLDTEVKQIKAEQITLDYKGKIDDIPVDLVLWTAGSAISPLIKNLALPHHNSSRLLINDYLQVLENEEIFALGDVAFLQQIKEDQSQQKITLNLPTNAQVAFQQADFCAWNLWAMINHKPLLPFRYQNLGEMMTLGINNATLSGLGVQLDGLFAHLTRRLIYLYRFPTWQHQLNVGINWLLKPIIDALSES
jgi:demethylphylloquinone reductase